MLNRLSETLREDDVGKLGSALKKARHEAESAKQSEKAALERGLQLEKEREAVSAEVEKLKSTRQPDTSSSACRGGQAGHSTAVAELVRCFHDTGKISTFAMSRALATMEAFKQIKTVESSKPPVRIAVFTPSGYRLDAAATNNALDNLAVDMSRAVQSWKPTDDDPPEDSFEMERAALRKSAAQLSHRLVTTEQQLADFRVMIHSALRRANQKHSTFDTDGYLLGGDDGLLQTSPTGDLFRGRPYTPDDLVTMSVG